jgi:hypothetical protein
VRTGCRKSYIISLLSLLFPDFHALVPLMIISERSLVVVLRMSVAGDEVRST